MRHLIIIPGLGDRGGLYRLCIPFWSLLGYKVHVVVFGWESAGQDFAVALERLVRYVDRLDASRCYMIGVSAGGTAAINVLAARPDVVARVVTVCTPYETLPERGGKLLHDSVIAAKVAINLMNVKQRERILSVYALQDSVVPTAKSKPDGIRQKALVSVGHATTIALSLSLYSAVLRRFLRE